MTDRGSRKKEKSARSQGKTGGGKAVADEKVERPKKGENRLKKKTYRGVKRIKKKAARGGTSGGKKKKSKEKKMRDLLF